MVARHSSGRLWTRIRRDSLGGYRIPARACPQGHHAEKGRREFHGRIGLLGRFGVRVRFTFEANACPVCGTELLRECGRCHEPILFPLKPRCESCGLPQPWAPERVSMPTHSRGRRWRGERADGRVEARAVVTAVDDPALWVIQGDVTEFAVDGIVSDDDVDGRMWTQVASAIKRAAGDDVETRSASERPFALGSAWVTHAGELADVQRIIHVALWDRHGQTTLDNIALCLRNAFKQATDLGLRSLAVAAVGTAPGAVRRKDWIPRIAEEAVRFRDGSPKAHDLALLFVLYEPEDFDRDVARFAAAARRAAARRRRARRTQPRESPEDAVVPGSASAHDPG